MDIKESMTELTNLFYEHKKRVEFASEIAKKVDPFLPPKWYSSYIFTWNGLLFCQSSGETDHDISMAELKLQFPQVCSVVEQASGIKLDKKPWIEDDHLFCIKAEGFLKVQDGITLHVEVRQFDTRACELEYEEKTVRIAKLSDGCLGIMSAEEVKS